MTEIVKSGSVAFVLKVIGAGLAFMFNILLAHILGPEGAGIYFLALTVTTITSVLGRMGLDNTLLRFVAAGSAAGDWVYVKGVYHKGMMLALTASSISALIAFVAASWLAETVFVKPELTAPIRWMTFAVVPMVLLTLYGQMLKGLKRIRDSQLVQMVGVPALSLLGVYVLGQVWGIKGVIWAYTLAVAFTALLGHWMWRVATPQLRGIIGSFETRDLLRSSMPLFWASSTNLLMNWTATFMIGIWGTNAEVGIFSVASRTAILTSLILTAVNSIAAPQFAMLYRQGNMDALASTARNCAKLMALMASPALLLFVVAPEWVLGLFGPQFVKGSTVLIILAIAQFVNVAAGSVGPLLMMTGNERSMRNSVTLSAFASVALNLVLIPYCGLIGAAFANALSLLVFNGICLWAIRRNLGINIISLRVNRL